MNPILIVEDEIAIGRLLRDYLDRAGFRPVIATTGASGLERFAQDKPDLVILDLGLPDRNGLDVLREIRSRGTVPVIVLTARGDEVDRIVGLELGADDYVVKPFSPGEVVARVRAVLRRGETRPGGTDLIRSGQLEIDLPGMRVRRGAELIQLTPTEFHLLATLASEPGRVFTRTQLLNAIRGVMSESYERAIDAHVKNIRRKLESPVDATHYIQTVHGVGYRFSDA